MARKLFGLVGRNIDYSFSRNYFSRKFSDEGLTDCEYINFDLADIGNLRDVIAKNPDLIGLNVTIPYKQSALPHLDKLDATAQTIGAVNTIKINKNGILEGFNTDAYGFMASLKPLLKAHHKSALILGTGGASKAVAYVFDNLSIGYRFVSRNSSERAIGYDELSSAMKSAQIIVNTTPVGTFPNVDQCPDIPYERFTANHIAYDLVYNPSETLFLKQAAQRGATTKTGLEMLQLQAEKSWEIWNNRL